MTLSGNRTPPQIPRAVVPSSQDEVATILRDANRSGEPVGVVGGRTAWDCGPPTHPLAIALSTAGLTGVRDYEPTDLTVSVGAGTTFAELRTILAENGQEVALDVPFPERATMGGLVATAFAGPRRLGSGTLRDNLIGCTYVRGDGLAAKAGGMVVKNVSGFEISRFLHGSWGTLAVLTSVNLKVTPIPKADRTLVLAQESLLQSVMATQRLLAEVPAIQAAELLQSSGATRLAIRLLGRERALQAQHDEVVARLGAPETVYEGDDSRDFWQRVGDAGAALDTTTEAQFAVGGRPSQVSSILKQVADRLGARFQDLTVNVSPGIGTVRIRGPESLICDMRIVAADAGPRSPDRLDVVAEFGSEGFRFRASEGVLENTARDLMSSLKREFDPNGLLNPGRLFLSSTPESV